MSSLKVSYWSKLKPTYSHCTMSLWLRMQHYALLCKTCFVQVRNNCSAVFYYFISNNFELFHKLMLLDTTITFI